MDDCTGDRGRGVESTKNVGGETGEGDVERGDEERAGEGEEFAVAVFVCGGDDPLINFIGGFTDGGDVDETPGKRQASSCSGD